MSWTRIVSIVIVVALLALPCLVVGQEKAGSGDWPQWRGPERSGVAPETGLLKEWPKEGPPLLWKGTGLGGGYSTPSVAGGRIYTLGSRDGQEYAEALDVKDGHQLWSTRIGPVGRDGPPSYPGPRSTPTVDGDRIYVLGSDGDLACLDTEGKVAWQKNLGKDFGGEPGRWAYAESPLIDGDALICTPGGSSATLVALNKKNGEVIWKAAVPKGNQAAYA